MIKIRGVKNLALNVSSFDFYGFSKDPAIKQVARDALDRYGCGSCGPRGFYGTIDQHLIFEAALAKFMEAEVIKCR
jgi:serine palmitoyltransferase